MTNPNTANQTTLTELIQAAHAMAEFHRQESNRRGSLLRQAHDDLVLLRNTAAAAISNSEGIHHGDIDHA